MSAQRPPSVDPVAAERWEQLVPVEAPWLHEEVARRMEARLQWMVHKPARWVHWEPLRGGLKAHALLAARYPKSECYMVLAQAEQGQAAHKSIASPWWSAARWTGPVVRWGLPPGPVDLMWSNMALHMSSDPVALMAQWAKLVNQDGFLMFFCLGPDTLRELRAVYQGQGWPLPTHEYTDMHDLGDMLLHAGFAEPVMDMERITLTYSSPQSLLEELRGLGRNVRQGRFQGLRGRGWHRQLQEAMARELPDPAQGGRLKLTFEIIYGHAFKPAPRMAVSSQSSISLQQMRGALGLRQEKKG